MREQDIGERRRDGGGLLLLSITHLLYGIAWTTVIYVCRYRITYQHAIPSRHVLVV